MAHKGSLTKVIYDPSRFKTPNVKEASSSEHKELPYQPPILMDEFGQTPDHFYLARKPQSFFQVKRKLDLQQSFQDNFNPSILWKKIPKPHVKRKKKDAKHSTRKKQSNSDKPRYDTSLGQLTKKFLELLMDATDGVLNLNTACSVLCVAKRRLYDITNVLEGAGLVKKTSRNNIQWMGRESSPSSVSPVYNKTYVDLEKEIDVLEAKENKLDELIYHVKSEISALKESEGQYHYVTINDLKSVEDLSKKMILGIKIASSGQLIEAFEKKVIFNSKFSEIEAVLLSEDTFIDLLYPSDADFKENSYNFQIMSRDQILEDTSAENSSYYQVLESAYSNICDSEITWTEGDTVIKNAFISEQEDIGPMGKNFLLQTEDQELDSLPFNQLETEVDSYLFSLDDGEGLTDLFDCNFSCP